MDHGGPTTLQPRPVRAVRLVAARVEGGPDAGRDSGDGRRTLTVGSSADCGLVLADPTVSRYHLEVHHAPDGLALVDLGSRNGTFVGALRIERAVVPPGTRVRIGASTLLVEDAGARSVPGAAADELLPGLVAHSPAMREVAALARRLAAVQTSVLIEGETGVGKEVVARAIHDLGPRRAGPFVVVDCGSMPATLIAAQLFGHEKGAFTGADARRAGAFERAGGGTIFLDEIGELPLDLQPALLGVLERHRFTRVGGAEPVAVDVRVLAATHRDLRGEVNAGTFRADLYFRLAVARIVIPPLRDRLEDLEPLVAGLVERFTGVAPAGGDHPLAGAMDALRRQRWPGNVRELRNVVEAAVVLGELPDGAGAGASPPSSPEASSTTAALSSYRDAKAAALAAFERTYLAELLARAGGNVSAAARAANMDRPYLIQLLRRHDLK